MTNNQEQYRYGIPTRADVKDPAYQDAVKRQELDWMFWPSGTIIINNHVAEVLRFTKELPIIIPEQVYKDRIPQPEDDYQFPGLLRPAAAANDAIANLDRFEGWVRQAEPYIPNYRKDDYWIQTTKRKYNLPAGVSEEKASIRVNGNDEKGWEYRFNPSQVLAEGLSSYRFSLESIPNLDLTNVEKIQKLYASADEIEHGSVKDLTEYALRIEGSMNATAQDWNETTEAGRLYKLNMEMAKGSDMWVRFDNVYLNVKQGNGLLHMIPFDCLADEATARSTGHGLSTRLMVRDEIQRLLENGGAVINGSHISTENGLSSDHKLPDWLVNLIPYEVKTPDGIQEPAAWVAEEGSLVMAYRILTDRQKNDISNSTVREILSKFPSFRGSSEFRTDQDITEGLKHSLGYHPI